MLLYNYVVLRDYGFAPNPFHGVCTLATCKPRIRKGVQAGDWIVGMGSQQKGLLGRMVFAMRVEGHMTFDAYWHDPRFAATKPYLPGSTKQRYGDNIYRGSAAAGWFQADSHHSYDGGVQNPLNIERDTSVDKVLYGEEFYYFGRDCPQLPPEFANLTWPHPGHKKDFPEELVTAFVRHMRGTYTPGRHGLPIDW